MPPKYRRKTPVAERVYRSSPALVQQKFPSLNLRRRAGTSTPSSATRQSTLTQMDFAGASSSRRSFDRHEEIPDSEDEEFDVPRSRKRRRTDGTLAPRGLAKQDTLTQMDFVKLLKTSWSDEDELQEILQSADAVEDQNGLEEQRQKSEDLEKDDKSPRRSESHDRKEDSCSVQDGKVIADSEAPSSIPNPSPVTAPLVFQTPKKVRKQVVPSSQSPAVTPITICSRCSERSRINSPSTAQTSPTLLRKKASNLPASQSQHRQDVVDLTTIDAIDPNDVTSSAITQNHSNDQENLQQRIDATLQVAQDKLCTAEVEKSPLSPAIAVPPQSRSFTERCSNARIQHPTQPRTQTQTQTQTQTSPATKRKIEQFNARWAELELPVKPMEIPSPSVKGNRPERPIARRTPKKVKFQPDTFTLGEETQQALLNDDFESNWQVEQADISTTPHPEEDRRGLTTPKASLRRDPSFEIPWQSDIVDIEQDGQNRSIEESPVLSKFRRKKYVPSSSQEDDDIVLESPIKKAKITTLPLSTQSLESSTSPIRASQASTVPCTPQFSQTSPQIRRRSQKSGQVNGVMVPASQGSSNNTRTPLSETNASAMNEESQQLPEYESIGDNFFKRPAGISQLLPSSIMNSESEIPLPPLWQDSLERDE